ncbi:MAG TPA: FAD:protein FMN transferase [Pelomicrobium sp.]|nr:FAD:protein FMN transferase [Pelomicrobium sp.]
MNPLRASAPLRFGVLALALIALLAGCAHEAPVYREQQFVFGTLVEVTIAGEPEARARELAAEVFAEFQRLHRTYHAWEPSALSALNEGLGREPVSVDDEMAGYIRESQDYAQRSGGLFDPGIGALVKLWGFHGDRYEPRLPDPDTLAALVAKSPSVLQLTLANGKVASGNPAVKLDFGGYLKGKALDLAAERLKRAGAGDALINIGGNVIALGRRGDRPWRIGIQHPRQPGPIATLELRDGEAVGTSGDYQRFFELDGRRYCHLLDPRSGRPVQGVQAATVIAGPGPQAGVLSDVASKPVFIAGPDGFPATARGMGINLAVLIDGEGRVYVTPELAERLSFGEPKPDVRVARAERP